MSKLKTSPQIQETNEYRDVLSFLSCSNNAQRCFLCFKTSKENVDIFLDFFIINGQGYCKKSIYILVAEIFTCNFQDILSDRVCSSCMELILKIYKMLKRYETIRRTIRLILNSLNREIQVASESLSNDDVQCQLNLKLFINTMQIQKPVKNGKLDSFVSVGEKDVGENFHCPKFNLHFNNLVSLKDHKKFTRSVSNNSKVCETCGKVCKSSALLKAHLNCHKVKKCPHCSKLLKTHTHFYYHVKRHLTGDKRLTGGKTVYRCHNCGYTSKNKKSLEAHHNKEHLRIRPYTCEICSRGFYKQSNLVEHNRTHTKIKTDVCHVCGDSFVTKKCLKEHLRLHTGEKPYKCEQCDDSFVSSGRRADHVKRKHLEKSELCVSCGKIFSLKKDLDRHVKNVHARDNSAVQNSPLRDGTAEIDDFNSFNQKF